MVEYAYLKGNVRVNPVTQKREAVWYEWEGASPFILVSSDLLHQFYRDGTLTFPVSIGNTISFPPYRLRFVRWEGIVNQNAVFVRANFPLWWAIPVVSWAARLLDLIYRRMIITLAVWGLAEFQEAVLPTWRNIKLWKVIERKKARK